MDAETTRGVAALQRTLARAARLAPGDPNDDDVFAARLLLTLYTQNDLVQAINAHRLTITPNVTNDLAIDITAPGGHTVTCVVLFEGLAEMVLYLEPEDPTDEDRQRLALLN